MTDPFLIPPFQRISDQMENWWRAGVGFGGEHGNVAEWRPRELNKRADAMANKAMDTGQSFSNWAEGGGGLKGACVLIFTDGGEGIKIGRRRRDGWLRRWLRGNCDGRAKGRWCSRIIKECHPL